MPQSRNSIEVHVTVQSVSPHFCYNIHNLFHFFWFFLLFKKGGWLATQSTPPPKSTLNKDWKYSQSSRTSLSATRVCCFCSTLLFSSSNLSFAVRNLIKPSLLVLPDLLFQRKLPVSFEALIHRASTHKFLQHQFPEKDWQKAENRKAEFNSKQACKHHYYPVFQHSFTSLLNSWTTHNIEQLNLSTSDIEFHILFCSSTS